MDTPKFDAWRMAERDAFAAERRYREALAVTRGGLRGHPAALEQAARALRAIADALLPEAMAELQTRVTERLGTAPTPPPQRQRPAAGA